MSTCFKTQTATVVVFKCAHVHTNFEPHKMKNKHRATRQ